MLSCPGINAVEAELVLTGRHDAIFRWRLVTDMAGSVNLIDPVPCDFVQVIAGLPVLAERVATIEIPTGHLLGDLRLGLQLSPIALHAPCDGHDSLRLKPRTADRPYC